MGLRTDLDADLDTKALCALGRTRTCVLYAFLFTFKAVIGLVHVEYKEGKYFLTLLI